MGEDTPRRRGGVGAGAGGARGLLPPPRRLRLLSWPLRRNAGRPRGPCEMRSQDATVTRQPAPPQASAFTAPRRDQTALLHPGGGPLPGPGGSPGMSPYAFVCCLEVFAAKESPREVQAGHRDELFLCEERERPLGGRGRGEPPGAWRLLREGSSPGNHTFGSGSSGPSDGGRGWGHGRWGLEGEA